MKSLINLFFVLFVFAAVSCATETTESTTTASAPEASAATVGQSGVQDETSNPNIVQVAVGNKDFSTLVTAVKAAGLVDALSNAGPFTVFAPTNAAFDKLPKGTVEGLLKPEILQDGATYEMVNGGKVKITKKDGKTFVNDVEIAASVPTSNGIIHVIGDVLLPK